MKEWQEENSEGYVTFKEDEFDAEHNLKELEMLLKESEYKELKTISKELSWHGQIHDTTWQTEQSRLVEVEDIPTLWRGSSHAFEGWNDGGNK